MHALLVNHRYYPYRGGSEIYIQKLAEWLVAHGWQTTVVTTDAFDLEYFWDRNARQVEAPGREMISGVEVVRVPVRPVRGRRYSFGAIRRSMGEASRLVPWAAPFRMASRLAPNVPGLRAALEDCAQPDIVIGTNLGIEGLALEARDFSERRGIPFVLVPFAHLGGGPGSVARRYVSMPHHRDLVRSANLLLAMTALEAEWAVGIGASRSNVETVGAGVELTEVTGGNSRYLDLLFGEESFVVASLGALAPDKGSCDLVEASSILRDRGTPVELVLIGPQLGQFREWMRERGADMWPWVHLPGVISDAARSDVLAGMDVLALPSRTESFGIVYLEAWANEKPVVGASVGAVNQIIADGVDGFLVPFGDPGALADALDRLAASQDLRLRMGIAGHRKVLAHYTWDRVLTAIGEAFERVLGLRVSSSRNAVVK